jgi:hypothetical protein
MNYESFATSYYECAKQQAIDEFKNELNEKAEELINYDRIRFYNEINNENNSACQSA